jgi:hypothetical protein
MRCSSELRSNEVLRELALPQHNSAVVSMPIADAADKLKAAGNRASPERCASASICTTPRTIWTGCSTLWGITGNGS